MVPDFLGNVTQRRPAVQRSLLRWAAGNSRSFPWRNPNRTAYEVLVAEVLLKRTTATAAARVYAMMLRQYPTPAHLGIAHMGDLVGLLKTIGLQSQRSRHLMRLGEYLTEHEGGDVPSTLEGLLAAPGLGPYSARAVLSFGWGTPAAVVDSNVERVLRRVFKDCLPSQLRLAELQEIADLLLPDETHRAFNLGLLDLGALVCRYTRPRCRDCPLAQSCDYNRRIASEDGVPGGRDG